MACPSREGSLRSPRPLRPASASRADRPSLGFSTSLSDSLPISSHRPLAGFHLPLPQFLCPFPFHLPQAFFLASPLSTSPRNLRFPAPPALFGLPTGTARAVPRAWAAAPAPSGRPSRAAAARRSVGAGDPSARPARPAPRRQTPAGLQTASLGCAYFDTQRGLTMT